MICPFDIENVEGLTWLILASIIERIRAKYANSDSGHHNNDLYYNHQLPKKEKNNNYHNNVAKMSGQGNYVYGIPLGSLKCSDLNVE